MPKEKPPLVEELTWKEVRDTVEKTCKDVCNIIDDISPGKDFTVFRVYYPFGAKILEKSAFYLPTTENNNDARAKLSYNIVPLGIILKNTVELFYDIDRKIISLAVLGNGLKIGIWEHFGWTSDYSITSGARSLYMLPKISETLSHKQLKKKFGITESPPKHFYDHWQVFFPIDQK